MKMVAAAKLKKATKNPKSIAKDIATLNWKK